MIGRWQWPGYAQSATMGSFAFSKSIDRIYSGIGLTVNELRYNNNGLHKQNIGLQYGYRVVVLDNYLLSIGAGLYLQQDKIEMPVFDDGFSPKKISNAHLLTVNEGKNLYASYGLIVQPFSATTWYAGFSVRNQLIQSLKDQNNLKRGPAFSVQLMKALPMTRRSSTFLFLSYEYNTPLQNDTQNIRPSFSMLMAQVNFLYDDKYSVGLGYKSFMGNYGLLHYRLGYTTGHNSRHHHGASRHRVTIGLSYDIKPYIQHDHIHSFSSYEMFIKYKILYNQN